MKTNLNGDWYSVTPKKRRKLALGKQLQSSLNKCYQASKVARISAGFKKPTSLTLPHQFQVFFPPFYSAGGPVINWMIRNRSKNIRRKLFAQNKYRSPHNSRDMSTPLYIKYLIGRFVDRLVVTDQTPLHKLRRQGAVPKRTLRPTCPNLSFCSS